MKVLVVHNRYQQAGGEDAVVRDEITLLRGGGVAVELYERDNADINGMSKLDVLRDTLWSRRTVQALSARLQVFKPDVLHVHNTFPLVSPSVYAVAAEAGIPVVQTLHNFRWLCPQAMLLRDGRICENCVGKVPWRAVAHACYRGSRVQSAVVAGMVTWHRAAKTLHANVSRYIALNAFSREVFVRGGFPAERVVVKPNFVAPSSVVRSPDGTPSRFLFVGRLSEEKGCAVLAQACRLAPTIQVDVIGAGDEAVHFEGLPNVTLHGLQPPDEVARRMVQSVALVLPSICYENFPRTLVEALSCGLPIIGSRLGAMERLIDDGETGLLFAPGDAQALADRMAWMLSNAAAVQNMSVQCLRVYDRLYRPEKNLALLLEIYRAAQEHAAGGAVSTQS